MGERSLPAKRRLTFSNGKMQTHGQTCVESPPSQLFVDEFPKCYMSHCSPLPLKLNNGPAMGWDGKLCSLTPSYFLKHGNVHYTSVIFNFVWCYYKLRNKKTGRHWKVNGRNKKTGRLWKVNGRKLTSRSGTSMCPLLQNILTTLRKAMSFQHL